MTSNPEDKIEDLAPDQDAEDQVRGGAGQYVGGDGRAGSSGPPKQSGGSGGGSPSGGAGAGADSK
jgi:hypothetical protein